MNFIKNNQYFKRTVAFGKFYKKRLYVFGCFSTVYLGVLYKFRNHQNEIFRMALAGSLSNMIWDVGFHFADTVNTRAKINSAHFTTYGMLNKIFTEEGLYGLSKGISASFYGSIACGFIYFSWYKMLKSYMYQNFGQKLHSSLIFLTSAFMAECVTLMIYYPYDLVKSRLQTSNRVFGYKSLLHAFQKEISTNGFLSLYKGGSAYLMMFATMISVQFSIYESIIKHIKQKHLEYFKRREAVWIVSSSFVAGVVGSALTNGFEVLLVTSQTQPNVKLMDIVRKEKFGLLTKGLGARVYGHSLQSVVFFSTVTYVGRLFNVELEDW